MWSPSAGQQLACSRSGDRVVAGVKSGGFAEEVVVPQDTVFHLPAAVDFTAAVQFPTIYATAYGALTWRANMQAGETLLVHGAAGGSGLAAMKIGKQLGARVVATAGTVEKVAAAIAHGADVGINYHERSFREAVLELTEGRGADVIFDLVGGETFDESLRCVAPEGRLIPMGFAGGSIPQIPANILLVKSVTAIGFYWGYYMGWGRQVPPPGTADRVRSAFERMLGWAAEGRLRPETYCTFPLADFHGALGTISQRQVIGRVALLP